ncbi:hypothetical protein [Glutamicibacter sp.]|jgi:hypothetical protein|uniref:hypothetical protein n=1 Tax=Glutamicibacter sp. TaxID=1931995 RepID=UPI002FD944A0
MSFWTRLIGNTPGESGISPHIVVGMLAEVERLRSGAGRGLTQAQAGNILDLTTAEKNDAKDLMDRLASPTPYVLTLVELHEILLIANTRGLVNNPYETASTLKARIGGLP